MSKKTYTNLDNYKGLPHFDFIDQRTLGFLAEIDFSLRAVRDDRLGPYGALEHMVSAINDFAEAWGRLNGL